MSDQHERDEQTEGGAIGANSRTLESAESYLARSSQPGQAIDGGGAEFSLAFKLLLEWGEDRRLIRHQSEFPFFSREPDAYGDEHQTWFDEATNRWFKATYPNTFGAAWGRKGSANAKEYVTRLLLQNRYFGDDIRLVALINSEGKLRILTSQPHIVGEPARESEIRSWFSSLGFRMLRAGDAVAWYLPEENLLIGDAHEGNIIRTTDGLLIPIDLNLIQPAGELFTWAREQSRS